MKTIAACMVSLSLIACSGGSDNTAANANPAQAATVDGDQSPPPIPASVPVIKHYYSLEDAGEYGYEQGLSEDDIKSGTATKPLIMVRYLGKVDGTYSVQSNEGSVRLVSSCETPCEFVKSRAYLGDTLVKTMTIPNAQGSILWEAMEDAMNGFLDAPQAAQTQAQVQPENPAQMPPPVQQPIKEANVPVSPSAEEANIGPSFNCAKAVTNVEIMICGNPGLSALDRNMLTVYRGALASASTEEAGKIKSDGVIWRTTIRDKCDTVDCLRLAYTTRLEEMTQK